MDTEYWKSSPFGENSIFHPSWEEKEKERRRQKIEPAKITGIKIERGTLKEDSYDGPRYDNLDPQKYLPDTMRYLFVKVSIIVTIYTSGYASTVFVAIDNDWKQARQAYLKTGTFQKSFTVQIPSSKRKGTFVISAKIADSLDSTPNDMKKYKVEIDDNGCLLKKEEIKENQTEEEDENICDCGKQYKGLVKCTQRYGKYGPVYWGKIPLKTYKEYDTLVEKGVLTDEEKRIIIAISENEGAFDTVQSYDSEVLSAGAMQKTINSSGAGEFPLQVWEFKLSNEQKYEIFLKKCNWEVREEKKEYKMYYNGVTGEELKSIIRTGFNKDTLGKAVDCPPFYPIISLLKDSDFIKKQIFDFVERLHKCLAKIPLNYNHPISDYIHSALGKAVVLDHDVNRPGHVKKYFSEALKRLFEINPNIPENPNEWGDKHSDYEAALISIYGPLRGEVLSGANNPMTNATKRFNLIKSAL